MINQSITQCLIIININYINYYYRILFHQNVEETFNFPYTTSSNSPRGKGCSSIFEFLEHYQNLVKTVQNICSGDVDYEVIQFCPQIIWKTNNLIEFVFVSYLLFYLLKSTKLNSYPHKSLIKKIAVYPFFRGYKITCKHHFKHSDTIQILIHGLSSMHAYIQPVKLDLINMGERSFAVKLEQHKR